VALDRSEIADLVTEITTAVSRTADEVSEDIYKLILREIPQLDEDKPLLALLASSVDSNVATCLQIMQHRIDLDAVRAPASALEYARRLAQRGTPLTALLRAYRIGHTRFSEWLLMELARHTDDAATVTETVRSVTGLVAGYIDQVSEEMVTAYTQERENWLRNRSAARAARIRDLLSGARIDVSATEATLGYRLRQYHVGVVCWADDTAGTGDEIIRLERAIGHIATQTSCGGTPVFLPRDESSAWAWLPLGIRDRFSAPSSAATSAATSAGRDPGIHVAFGDAANGADGFRLTHLQAIAAQTVALAGGSPPPAVSYSEVAPIAMMLGSADLLRAWVLSTLGDWPPTTSTMPACATPCWSSCRAEEATRRRPNDCCCTRTRSSTGSARLRRALAGRWRRTAITWSWRCGPATGSAPPCSVPTRARGSMSRRARGDPDGSSRRRQADVERRGAGEPPDQRGLRECLRGDPAGDP